MTWGETFSLISVTIAVALFAFNMWDRKKTSVAVLRNEWKSAIQELDEKVEKYVERYTAAHEQLAVIQAQVSVFWKGVAYNGALALHSPHSPEFDALIERFVRGELTEAEMLQFRAKLFAIARDTYEERFRRYVAQEVLLSIYVQSSHSVMWSLDPDDLRAVNELIEHWVFMRGASG